MRAVLDTNVIISGLILPDSIPGGIVKAWRSSRFTLILSEPMLGEIGTVLGYPKISSRLKWDAETIRRYLSLLRFHCELVDISEIISSAHVPGDPKDAAILATFIAGKAECLVSGDADLLALAGQYRVLKPADAYALLCGARIR